MTDAINPPTPRRDSERSGFSRSTPAVATDARSNGGSGVQRSHLRDRKTWLKKRTRSGHTWAQRKAMSVTYCPAKRAA